MCPEWMECLVLRLCETRRKTRNKNGVIKVRNSRKIANEQSGNTLPLLIGDDEENVGEGGQPGVCR